jgi:DNA repair exonuclease SbcCD ATPase subunit
VELLDILLSGQVLVILAGVAAFAILIRALTSYLGEAAELRVRLATVQAELDKARENLPQVKAKLEEARALVQPLRVQLQALQGYYGRLRELECQALAEAETQEAPKDTIQVHRPGMPGL